MNDHYSDNQPELIHCENCGEDYAATYRSCPFCGAPRGAKKNTSRASSDNRNSRTRTNTRGGGYGGTRSPLSILGIVIALVLVVAAIIIVIALARRAVSNNRTQEEEITEPSSLTDEEGEKEEGNSMVVVPNALTLDQTALTLTPDDNLAALVATPDPEGWVGTVEWISSDASIATVTSTGVVAYVSDGICTVTANASGITATCTVTCSQVADEAEGDSGGSLVIKSWGSATEDISLSIGESATLTAEGGDGENYIWSVEDAGVLSIDPNSGQYVALAQGMTTITVTSGEESTSITVRVK